MSRAKKFLVLATALLSLWCRPLPSHAGTYAFDTFGGDPAAGGRWRLSSGWTWDEGSQVMVSTPDRRCLARWLPFGSANGRLSAWIKFPPGGSLPPKASLLFNWRTTAPSAYRYVTLKAGSPGRVILGQKGTIGGLPGGTLASVPATIQRNRWYYLRVTILRQKITIHLSPAGRNPALVLARGNLRSAPGSIGLMSAGSLCHFDNFGFSKTSNPNRDICGDCHAGSPPPEFALAPNVMTYWDGSWWDGTVGEGSAVVQQGGHGDPDNFSPVTCDGCHEMNQSAFSHWDGLRHDRAGGTEAVTLNTYHLKAGSIKSSPDPLTPWDIQVIFDRFCYSSCHADLSIRNMIHPRDTDPVPGAMQFGTHITLSDGESISFPVDSDLTSGATATEPDFAPCITCHDPHGTGVLDTRGDHKDNSNFMLRKDWFVNDFLCSTCHI